MEAYKLVRKIKEGVYSSLFINKKNRLLPNIWLDSELHPTKGFAVREGWHCLLKPEAPHLSKKNRVWVKVEVEDFEYFERPISQGGKWVLAKRMKILNEYNLII